MRSGSLHTHRSAALQLAGVVLGALALMATLASAPALAAPRVPGRALHASYVSSDPAANAVVKAAPAVVTIHFAEAVDPAGSAITVYDAKGQIVSQAAQVDANDLKTMHAPMTGTGSEVYLVTWHTVSATDGDPDVGAFSFFVNASGASELAPKAPTTPTTTVANSAGTPAWLVALIGLVGLIVGAAGGVAWSRSRVGASGAR